MKTLKKFIQWLDRVTLKMAGDPMVEEHERNRPMADAMAKSMVEEYHAAQVKRLNESHEIYKTDKSARVAE